MSLIEYPIPLGKPYHLSFGVLQRFDTFYVLLEDGPEFGMGEITPLPGYGHETRTGVPNAVERAGTWVQKGMGLREAVSRLWEDAPFAASGIACALETLGSGGDKWFSSPAPCRADVAALCHGVTPEEAFQSARRLAAEGYGTLKIKVGQLTPSEDAERVKAAAAAVPSGVSLRLDANQGFSMRAARFFCDALEGLEAVESLEQPFPRDEWALHESLAGSVTLPIMLDESIWGLDDVRRAADCGAQAVKFKLCKHPGMHGSREMILAARRLGLSIVYGNGVQSALGNHLEMIVYCSCGLLSAFEGNGFLKPFRSPVPHGISVRAGRLVDEGLREVPTFARSGKRVFEMELPGRCVGK